MDISYRTKKDNDQGPRFWASEENEMLRMAVLRYLDSQELTISDIAFLRRYLEQWIMADVWVGDYDADRLELSSLRTKVRTLNSFEDIDQWTCEALRIGIDPW